MLEAHDSDLGSGGVTIPPDQVTSRAHLMVTAGKEGRIFLINRDNLGKVNSTVNCVVQQQVAIHGLFGPPTFWNNTLYFIAVKDNPRRSRLTMDG